VCFVIAWLAILFTGRYPRDPFDVVLGVGRWGVRVEAYALLLATDRYPPFSLSPQKKRETASHARNRPKREYCP
jgi:hypothetical protein